MRSGIGETVRHREIGRVEIENLEILGSDTSRLESQNSELIRLSTGSGSLRERRSEATEIPAKSGGQWAVGRRRYISNSTEQRDIEFRQR